MVPRPCQWWSWWRAHLEGWREVWTCTPGSLNKVLAGTGRHCTMNNGYLLLEVSYCFVVPSLVHLMQLKLSLVCPALLFQFFPQRYVLLPQVVVRLFLQSLLTETNNSCWAAIALYFLSNIINICGVWRLIGRFVTFHQESRGFESCSSRHVETLGKSFTYSCLWRFGVKLRQYPCCVGSTSE